VRPNDFGGRERSSYFSIASSVSPKNSIFPLSMTIVLSHSLRIACMLWLTSKMVLPSRAASAMRFWLLRVNAASPRKHLVDDHDVWLELGGDRECEPNLHATREMFDRGIDERADAGEIDNRVEHSPDVVA
jgi:hypothetical protein